MITRRAEVQLSARFPSMLFTLLARVQVLGNLFYGSFFCELALVAVFGVSNTRPFCYLMQHPKRAGGFPFCQQVYLQFEVVTSLECLVDQVLRK